MIAFIYNEKELSQLVEIIQRDYSDYSAIVLQGDLGAGKTTFVKHYCHTAGVVDDVTSPTFSLVNSYMSQQDEQYTHMDLYRINTVEELIDMGLDDYLSDSKLCFIEWADLALPFLQDYLHLSFESLSETARKIIITEVYES